MKLVERSNWKNDFFGEYFEKKNGLHNPNRPQILCNLDEDNTLGGGRVVLDFHASCNKDQKGKTIYYINLYDTVSAMPLVMDAP